MKNYRLIVIIIVVASVTVAGIAIFSIKKRGRKKGLQAYLMQVMKQLMTFFIP